MWMINEDHLRFPPINKRWGCFNLHPCCSALLQPLHPVPDTQPELSSIPSWDTVFGLGSANHAARGAPQRGGGGVSGGAIWKWDGGRMGWRSRVEWFDFNRPEWSPPCPWLSAQIPSDAVEDWNKQLTSICSFLLKPESFHKAAGHWGFTYETIWYDVFVGNYILCDSK